MKQLTLYFVDDVMYIFYKERVIDVRLSNIVSKGIIVDREKFIDEFTKILKKEKIKGKLFGDNIYVVKNVFYNVRDIFFLDSIFLELGFLKVIYLDIKKYISKNNTTYIEVNNSYMIIYVQDGIFLDLDYFKDLPRILDYFKNVYHGDLVLFGRNKNIPNIKLENKQIYYFENFSTYVVDGLLKVNK